MKPVIAYFVSSFALHLFWENVQMPLFESGDAPFWDSFTMCLWATATGDMLFMLTLYLTVALIHRGPFTPQIVGSTVPCRSSRSSRWD